MIADVPAEASVPVLISGAGPTGLVLAIVLARHGVRVRIIDAQPASGRLSRAMIVHARTLELYRQLGFGDEVASLGIPIRAGRIRTMRDGAASDAATLDLAGLGTGLTPYPMVLAFPQDEHEAFLERKLRELGVEVEREKRFLGMQPLSEGGYVATIRGRDGDEVQHARFIAGCDGLHSGVRESAGIAFSGGTYDQEFFVADVTIAGEFRTDVHVELGSRSLLLLFPVRKNGMQRIIGLVPPELSSAQDISFEDVRAHVQHILEIDVTGVGWFSRYRVHHRVAQIFRTGGVFLAGDAGHVHSPAGGQGMNTGIGDAYNLGWKLAAVIHGNADERLLQTYEDERLPFARTLVATTDRAFVPLIHDGPLGTAIRTFGAPVFLALLSRISALRSLFFRLISQIHIGYKRSNLNVGGAGGACGGDRYPWISGAFGDSYVPLRSLQWQAHFFGSVPEGMRAVCRERELPLHEFPWEPRYFAAGLRRGKVYVIRPDGYIGAVIANNDLDGLRNYGASLGLRFRSTAVARACSRSGLARTAESAY